MPDAGRFEHQHPGHERPGRPRRLGPTMATGKSRAVMATRKREIPSTPSFQEMPNWLIHGVMADELEAGLTPT